MRCGVRGCATAGALPALTRRRCALMKLSHLVVIAATPPEPSTLDYFDVLPTFAVQKARVARILGAAIIP